ncbi:CLUMA_CG004396, isoform A [Clunio marinus]|uniref:CLUMA_CG004396, isoform A n=1 Tax=Clunio marinus TaxID=568069 RepID=A0A1J1HT20_9DIPT|nr:CLUMA_CG004396, isoform A [Clunio marinus]
MVVTFIFYGTHSFIREINSTENEKSVQARLLKKKNSTLLSKLNVRFSKTVSIKMRVLRSHEDIELWKERILEKSFD